jgi:hypothetical protein
MIVLVPASIVRAAVGSVKDMDLAGRGCSPGNGFVRFVEIFTHGARDFRGVAPIVRRQISNITRSRIVSAPRRLYAPGGLSSSHDPTFR